MELSATGIVPRRWDFEKAVLTYCVTARPAATRMMSAAAASKTMDASWMNARNPSLGIVRSMDSSSDRPGWQGSTLTASARRLLTGARRIGHDGVRRGLRQE